MDRPIASVHVCVVPRSSIRTAVPTCQTALVRREASPSTTCCAVWRISAAARVCDRTIGAQRRFHV